MIENMKVINQIDALMDVALRIHESCVESQRIMHQQFADIHDRIKQFKEQLNHGKTNCEETQQDS